MENNFKKLNPLAKKSMLISSIVTTIIAGIVLSILRHIIHLFKAIEPAYFFLDIIFLIIFLIFALSIVLKPTIGFKRHKYRISNDSVEGITGIISINRTVIPIRRMQQISIETSWINRIFGLSDINIVTAGGSYSLEYIEKNEAIYISETLKKSINEIALLQAKNQDGYDGTIKAYARDNSSTGSASDGVNILLDEVNSKKDLYTKKNQEENI